jgi:hypothetical protein
MRFFTPSRLGEALVIPRGTKHRLSSDGPEELMIERFDDIYGRVKKWLAVSSKRSIINSNVKIQSPNKQRLK